MRRLSRRSQKELEILGITIRRRGKKKKKIGADDSLENSCCMDGNDRYHSQMKFKIKIYVCFARIHHLMLLLYITQGEHIFQFKVSANNIHCRPPSKPDDKAIYIHYWLQHVSIQLNNFKFYFQYKGYLSLRCFRAISRHLIILVQDKIFFIPFKLDTINTMKRELSPR